MSRRQIIFATAADLTVAAVMGFGPGRMTGAASGFLAGAMAASVYALACPEHSAAFIATWHTAGMAAAGRLGAVIGPRLLRW